jgi:hydrophobic/amphiphilic exporter-1 (mainly G- bacteria), HAE1 family
VDDAIVMLENIVRHLEMGKEPYQAAVDGAKEVGFTIISMTLSLAAVFIPLLFMGGIIGRLFREFAVTISVSILVSGFVSLSLTPMLCSRFLRAHSKEEHGRFYQVSEDIFNRGLKFYETSLEWVVGHRRATVILSGVLFLATLVLFVKIPKGFIPGEDIGFLFATTEAAEGVGFDAMKEHQKAVAQVLLEDPDVEAFGSSVVGGNAGRVFMRLKPRSERELSADQKVQQLRVKMAKIPGIRVFLMNPPPINIGGRFSAGLYQFTLQASDLDSLYKTAPQLEAKLRQNDMLQDVTSDLRISNPEVNVVIDRDRASSLGVSPALIEDSLFSAYGSRQISTILAPNNQYYVLLELLPQFQTDPASLNYLYIRSDRGELVPLSAISTIRKDIGPLSVNHSGQLPSVTISFNLRPGVSLSEAVDSVQKTARQTLPSNIVTNFSGTAQAFQSSQAGLLALLILAILVIYMILGILYESFIHPITILTGLPFAGFGALVTLLIFRVDLNVYSFVGLIMLIGVVKKNAIMMIDFAVEAEHGGMSAKDAILKACSIRFRPIMMTTMAALMGTLPIALGLGAGSESRRPLGLAVVGGLLFSQALTLYVTPVFYIYFDKVQNRLARRFSTGL